MSLKTAKRSRPRKGAPPDDCPACPSPPGPTVVLTAALESVLREGLRAAGRTLTRLTVTLDDVAGSPGLDETGQHLVRRATIDIGEVSDLLASMLRALEPPGGPPPPAPSTPIPLPARLAQPVVTVTVVRPRQSA